MPGHNHHGHNHGNHHHGHNHHSRFSMFTFSSYSADYCHHPLRNGHIHIHGYVPTLVGIILFAAAVTFLAAFVLPIVAKVLLSLVVIVGVVMAGAAMYQACRP